MNRIKLYLHANLYFLLPMLLMVVFLPILFPLFTAAVHADVLQHAQACSFEAGGGSLNLCENEVWLFGLVLAFVVSTPLAWMVSRVVIWRLRIHWLSPLFGLAFFYGMPLFLGLIHLVLTHGIYGEQRGMINNVLLMLDIVILLGSVLFISVMNFRRFCQQNVSG